MGKNYNSALRTYLDAIYARSSSLTDVPILMESFWSGRTLPRIIDCTAKAGHFMFAAVMTQFAIPSSRIDYKAAFAYISSAVDLFLDVSALGSPNREESNDYKQLEFIWDFSILEYFMYLAKRNGEVRRINAIVRASNRPELSAVLEEQARQKFILQLQRRFLIFMTDTISIVA
ncbi:hypothetical protein BJ742DRAFT_809728 [Cladochytrium replicatum]|nr:hypothetical protein BJ742DRAFT_809728 [Cladochytrium replicatum]